jgi:ferrous iron transport protein B
MKSSKWLWGGIGLQLGIGYTVAYLVYTVGTLLTAPESLNLTATLLGLWGVAMFVVIIFVLSNRANANKKSKA